MTPIPVPIPPNQAVIPILIPESDSDYRFIYHFDSSMSRSGCSEIIKLFLSVQRQIHYSFIQKLKRRRCQHYARIHIGSSGLYTVQRLVTNMITSPYFYPSIHSSNWTLSINKIHSYNNFVVACLYTSICM